MLRGPISCNFSCGDCGVATKKGYVEILEFTHFVEFFSFNKIGENHKEKGGFWHNGGSLAPKFTITY